MSRCVIIGAAKIKNYKFIKSLLRPDDFFIVCDAGFSHVKKLKINPSLILGDFDSCKYPECFIKKHKIQSIILPVKKDDTDSFFAAKEGVKRGFTDFLLAGVTGDRLDHTLVNISVLEYLYAQGCTAFSADDRGTVEIVGTQEKQIKDCSYFSLIPLSEKVSGIYLRGAVWTLENGTVCQDYVYTSSNQILKGREAFVRAEKGLLLLICIL